MSPNFWQHNRASNLKRPCPNTYVRIGASCPTCGRERLMVDSAQEHDMRSTAHGQYMRSSRRTGSGPRNVWLNEEGARLVDELRILNLSRYLAMKLQEDARRSSPLTNLRVELEAKREDLRRLQETFEAKALDTEIALHLFEEAARQARKIVAGDPRPMQTSLLFWIQKNPAAQKLREVLPADFDDKRLMDVLLRWPESRTEVQVLVEARS